MRYGMRRARDPKLSHMTAPQYPFPKPLRTLAAALLVAAAGGVQAQTASPPAEAALVESMKRLATEDPAVQKQRWGDLAAAAGHGWLHKVPGEVGNVWRDIRWVVPGALMRYHRGLCIAIRCQGTDYLVHYDERTGQLVFLDQGAPALNGRVQDDGSVRVAGSSLVGLLSGETLRFDAAAQTLFSDSHDLRPATGAQLAEATRGLAGDATAPAGTGTAVPASVPAAPAPAPAATDAAQLRAELAAVKAQMEALSRQLQAQQQAAPPPAAAPALSPASAAAEARRAQASAAAARAAELRAEREAQAQAARERKLAAEQQAREEAARRAEAAAQARQEAQARAEEARRLAQEQRAREEQARREAAEAHAREAQARAAEAKRLAEEKRAAQEAARSAAATPVAAAATVPTAAPASRTNACGGVDGLYGIVASNYRIEVKFAQDSLTVVEPNRTSVYKHLGQCQYGFTHPTGIEYRLGVVPRGLVAYKPGQSQAQKTPLALLQAAAAPQSSGSCKAQEIPVENPQALHPGQTRLYGAHAIGGVTLAGRYQAPEPDGHPLTVLGERGEGGEFEVYGAPKPQYVYRILRWYIQANCDGTLVEEDYPVAKRYYLIYQLDRPYSGLAWQRTQFIVRKNEDRVSIDDRSKRKN